MKKLAVLGFLLLLGFVLVNVYPTERPIQPKVDFFHDITTKDFSKRLALLLDAPFTEGNKIALLTNGVEIFPELFKAIQSARKTITFEAYIYYSDKIGLQIKEVLCEKAKQGVKVHMIIDWLGGKNLKSRDEDDLKRCGVEFYFYHPLKWYNISRINNRTHRRILVVDGEIGFTGGVGYSESWNGHGNQSDLWRDNMYRIEGPAVSQLQSAFVENWLKLDPRILNSDDYFPELKKEGKIATQIYNSLPGSGASRLKIMYMMVIGSAKKEIKIANPYFVPDDAIKELLVKARERGVRVEIIVPGKHIDSEVTRMASRADWGALLESGVKLYEFKPAMFHCKYLIADNYFVNFGSTNLDERSFNLNDEINVNVLNSDFAQLMTAQFEQDKSKSEQITLELWQQRPWVDKVKETIYRNFKSQL